MTLEERARAYLVKHDCPPGHRAIAAVVEAVADERQRCASYLDGYAGGHYMAQSCASAIRELR